MRAREIGFPVALKKSGVSGNSEGVILGIATERDCLDAATELLAGGQMLIVEKMIEGIELRIHFVNGRLFRILRSEVLSVTGDALAMVVPVVALARQTHVSRVGATLLSQVGLSDWIASSPDEYVERAVEYAGKPELLRQL